MRSFRQRSFLSLLALHDVIDDDWLVHAVSFVFPYFCVYFHLFAQTIRLGRLLLLLLLGFSASAAAAAAVILLLVFEKRSSSTKLFLLLVLARRKRKRREKFSPLDASYSSVVVCALFLKRAFRVFLRVSSFSPHKKKTRMSKRSFLGGTTLSSSLIISAAASGASVHPLPKATFFSADKDTTKSSSSFLSPFLVFFRE